MVPAHVKKSSVGPIVVTHSSASSVTNSNSLFTIVVWTFLAAYVVWHCLAKAQRTKECKHAVVQKREVAVQSQTTYTRNCVQPRFSPVSNYQGVVDVYSVV
jgi:hypothetical protein